MWGLEVPSFPVIQILGPRKADIGRVRACSQPANQFHQIFFSHRGASSRGAGRSSPNVKEDRAPTSWQWRVSIVPNFDKPAIRKVAAAHFLFFKPRRRILRVHSYVLVVTRIMDVVHPGIAFFDGVERVVGPRRQRSIVGVDHSDPKDACGSSMIMFHLHRTLILSADQASSPGQSGFSEKYRNRRAGGAPSFRGHIESLELAVHTIPGRCNSDDELGDRRVHAIFRTGE